ncbi:hypothetical protein Ancab_034686 [Ancistrocladus abbreviatus]
MASLGFHLKVLVICAVAGIGGNVMFVGGQCQGEFRALIAQYAMYVQKPGPKMHPSPRCCNVVKTVDVPCTCSHMTKEPSLFHEKVEVEVQINHMYMLAGFAVACWPDDFVIS